MKARVQCHNKSIVLWETKAQGTVAWELKMSSKLSLSFSARLCAKCHHFAYLMCLFFEIQGLDDPET